MKTLLISWKIYVFGKNILPGIALCLIVFLTFNACKKSDNSIAPVHDIESIDIKEMAKIHLKDFSFVRERLFYQLDTEYVFNRDSDKENIFITIGICPSAEMADSILNKYLSEMAGAPQNSPFQGTLVGDKFWWIAYTYNSIPHVTNVFFIRRNVYFMLSINNNAGLIYAALIDLAKQLDDDILNRASYITYRE